MIQLVGIYQEPQKQLSMFFRESYLELEFFCYISLLGMYLKKAFDSKNDLFNFQEYQHVEEVNAHLINCLLNIA